MREAELHRIWAHEFCLGAFNAHSAGKFENLVIFHNPGTTRFTGIEPTFFTLRAQPKLEPKLRLLTLFSINSVDLRLNACVTPIDEKKREAFVVTKF